MALLSTSASRTMLCPCWRQAASFAVGARALAAASPSLSPYALRRGLHAPATAPARIPQPSGAIASPEALLKAAGRGLDQYATKLGEDLTWPALFTKSGQELADAGMSTKDRRYLLWVLEKYRQGHDIETLAIPSKPKKKYRGWGPKIQFGKRVR
ncbi:hypothetical protein OIV83_006223 [Microbotryomycetes sp. JL201]|nr:hypothetical protein OIV83_006223 [Microbotryomycetes sp. JL201]